MFLVKAPDGKNNLVGKKLLMIRNERRLSQSKLAASFQLSGFEADRYVISRIESGKRYVTDIEISLISKVLGISIVELID